MARGDFLKIKKMLTLLIVVIMVFSVLPVSVFAEDEVIPISEYGGQIKSGKTYSISNAEEFLLFDNITNTYYNGVKIILTDNITVNTGVFSLDEDKNLLYNGKAIDNENMPILYNPIESFRGTIDGQGYSISGLYCSSESAGLFNNTIEAKKQNLNIRNSAFIGEFDAGSISNSCTRTTIKNCTSDAIVVGEFAVGGISGSGGTIDSCMFSGNVIGEIWVGGIVGISDSSIESSGNSGVVCGENMVGGVAGDFSGRAKNCFNTGDVYGDYKTGGFVGNISIKQYASSLSGSTSYHLYNCYTAGNVSGRYSEKFFGATASDFSIFWCCYFVGDKDDNCYSDIEKSYQNYLDSIESDPFGMGVIVLDIGIKPISEEVLKSEENLNHLFLIQSTFVYDCCNENSGYPIPQSLHKKHVWGEYTSNGDATCTEYGTMTATCIAINCKKQNTVTDTRGYGSHYYGDWESNNDATLFSEGTETRTCKCGHYETQTIESSSGIVKIFKALIQILTLLFR